jgi:glutathione S-transferase
LNHAVNEPTIAEASGFLLYGNRESGHSYKVKLLLAVANVAHAYEEINLLQPRQERPEPFRSRATFGEVPVLVHNATTLVQSDAILSYLAEHLHAYGAESAERMVRVREWLFWEANRIGFSLAHLRFARKFAPDEFQLPTIEWLRRRYEADITRLDQELSDGRAFILDERPTIADFALCGYMFWPEQAQVSYPTHVSAWLKRIEALPGWRHPYD